MEVGLNFGEDQCRSCRFVVRMVEIKRTSSLRSKVSGLSVSDLHSNESWTQDEPGGFSRIHE